MQITAPFGYGDIVPLEKTHKVLLPSIGAVTGSALFDKAGKPAPQWVEREDLLSEYEADLDLTAQMCAIFTKLELFSPFTMQVNEGGKQALELQGMRRIDEAKFLALKAANHKALIEKGLMGRVYAHFFSLANFARLYDRAVRQAPVKKTVRRGPKTSE